MKIFKFELIFFTLRESRKYFRRRANGLAKSAANFTDSGMFCSQIFFSQKSLFKSGGGGGGGLVVWRARLKRKKIGKNQNVGL